MKNIILNNIKPINIFKVPDGYFEELPYLIENKLSEGNLTSKLPSIKSNFDIPNGYFDTLSDRIFAKIDISENTKISLEKLPKENIFRVPDGYFDSLSEKIINQLPTEKQTKVLKVNWWQNSRVMWSAAASIFLVVGFLYMFLPNIMKSDTEVALNKVSSQEIAQYLETQDLSQLEIEAVEVAKNTVKDADNQLFEHLEVDDKDIIQHLETEDLEEI